MKTKVSKKNQKYEEYWKYTASHTNFENSKFLDSLKLIIEKIDDNDAYHDTDKKKPSSYDKLVGELIDLNKFSGDDAPTSARKLINTWLKCGFLKTGLKDYHPKAKHFLSAESKFERDTIRAEIFFEFNQLGASVSKPDFCRVNRVKFFVRTLEINKRLNKEDLAAIMITNPENYPAGYIGSGQLEAQKKLVKKIGFAKRKYNQISHFKQALSCLDQYIVTDDQYLHFKDDEDEVQVLRSNKGKPVRSQIEQALFRDKLILESIKIIGSGETSSRAKCMLTKLPMTKNKMVASHIWAYRSCNVENEYDPNNGLLLGENIDYYFDSGEISFTNQGKVLYKEGLDEEWKKRLNGLSLDLGFLTPERIKFFEIHRKINGF